MATQSLLAWCLGPAERGSYAVCVVFATLLNIFFVLGCDYATIYFVASKKFSLSQGVAQSLIYGGLGCVVAVTVGLILMHLPLPFLAKASPSSFHLALALIPLQFFAFTFIELMTAVRDFSWYAVFNVMAYINQLILVVLFVAILKWGVHGALLSAIIGESISLVVVVGYLAARHGLRLVMPVVRNLGPMLSYGLRFYLGKISNQMNFQIGTVILALFASKEEIGLFSVAAMMTARVMIIPDSLSAALIPRVAGDQTGRADLIARCARLVFVLCGVVTVLLAIFATPIVKILFSPEFLPAVPLIRVCAIGIVLRSFTKVFVPYLLGTNHPGSSSLSVAVGMVANFVVLSLLLPTMGIMAGAIGMTAGYAAGALLLTLAFLRQSGMKFRQVWRFESGDWAMVSDALHRVAARVGLRR
jgi:O-antigen/teichoic acid export membrane protein